MPLSRMLFMFFSVCLSESVSVNKPVFIPDMISQSRGGPDSKPVQEERVITFGGVLCDGRCSSGRRIQSPVQVSPELLLVLRMDQFIHTLVHNIRLRKHNNNNNNVFFFKVTCKWRHTGCRRTWQSLGVYTDSSSYTEVSYNITNSHNVPEWL